jgi:glycosyltransferase involved in cell wall biosynthesis
MASFAVIQSNALAYPRNQVLLRALRETFGELEIDEALSPEENSLALFFHILFHPFKGSRIFFLWPSNSRWLPMLAAKISGKRVIFDAFTSMYDSLVGDRKTVKPLSVKALYLYLEDYLCCHLADVLVFDTRGHKEYFTKTFKINVSKPCVILPVTVDIDWIDAQPNRPSDQSQKTEILFYGSFIPLQGIDVILKAVALAKDLPVHFSIIGHGQTFNEMKALAERLNILGQTSFIPPVPYSELISYIKSADLCLGIFGQTEKAKRVIPNKVLECAACGKPVVTGQNSEMAEYFQDGESIFFCPMDDPEGLANSIRRALENQSKLAEIGQKGRTVVQANFSLPVLIDKIRKEL